MYVRLQKTSGRKTLKNLFEKEKFIGKTWGKGVRFAI